MAFYSPSAGDILTNRSGALHPRRRKEVTYLSIVRFALFSRLVDLCSRLRLLGKPFLLGLVCFIVYNANLRQVGAGDSLPARYLPLILLRDQTLDLDAHAHLMASGHSLSRTRNRPEGIQDQVAYLEPWAYWMNRTRQHQLVPLYPIVTPLLVTPLYIPAVRWLNSHGWEQPQIDRIAELMEKISASILASVASVIMYLVLYFESKGREGRRWSLPLALAFAFGTNTWMISSQALWQHGTGELLIALGLLLVTTSSSPIRSALLGAVCVLMSANRPPDTIIAGALVIFAVWRQWRKGYWLFAGAVAPLTALLYYNLFFIGHFAGAYALRSPPTSFIDPGWTGIFGLLVSPARGLLIFSPFLFFVASGLIQRLKDENSRRLAILLSLSVLAQMLFYSQLDWRAGVSWGSRWLTDILPILIWMLAPAPLVMRRFTRVIFTLSIVFSIGVQAIGAFWYTKKSDELVFSQDPSSGSGVWSLSNIPFVTELRHPPAGGDLIYDVHGSLDQIGSTPVRSIEEVPLLRHEDVLEGWALAGKRSPAQLLILIDGIVIGSTSRFQPRLDVNTAMHTIAPSGWSLPANTRGVSPGERVLQLAVRINPRSNIRILREQRVLVVAPELSASPSALPQGAISGAELDAMAARATMLLREHQSESGFWLTSHTKKLHYQAQKPEMNTFLTSMLVDLISPIANHRNLSDVVEKAREHLANQIEGNGLVRYHGLPNGPTIGTLGCAITPDSDDTALVWRIASSGTKSSISPNDPRLKLMLEELAGYIDSRGLYYTWLAPQRSYRCIDPGSDPNPTDLTIQMNVYLMLRELDPPASQRLCNSLQRSFWDEDVWVYYSKAPIIPYLRSAELKALGCVVPRPTERLAFPAEGQEIWSEAVHQIVEVSTSVPDEQRRQAILNLLAYLGGGDFGEIRRSPPLLYHNDLSAKVSRFYWSEDFGYALWLRLYEATRNDIMHGKQ